MTTSPAITRRCVVDLCLTFILFFLRGGQEPGSTLHTSGGLDKGRKGSTKLSGESRSIGAVASSTASTKNSGNGGSAGDKNNSQRGSGGSTATTATVSNGTGRPEGNPFEEEEWDEYPNEALVDNGEPGVPVKALYDYEGAEFDELSFKKGNKV